MLNRHSNPLARSVLLALVLAAAGNVQAQSNSTGNLSGHVAAGDTVLVENTATGFRREISADAKGRFRLRALPIGTYVVKVKHADGRVEFLRQVAVRIGTTAHVN